MAIKGVKKFTEHISLAVTPEMKAAFQRAAEFHQADASVPLRWALTDWLESEASQGRDFRTPEVFRTDG